MASSRENSSLDEEDADREAAARRLRQLECVNRGCKNGDNLRGTTDFVCTYYNVTWKPRKKVCDGCLMQCLEHYKLIQFKFSNKKCIIDSDFPNYDSHMIIESSSSDEDEPMPSTSKYGLAPDKEFESRLSNSCRCLVKKYNDLIDVQKKLCDDYLDTKFRESMHEADLIDDTTHRLEDEIKSMRDVIYDPYKPILSSLPPDSDSDSDFIIIEEIIDEDSESDKIKDDKLEKREKGKSEKKKDYELDKNKEDEETNKLHKIDNNKNEVTDKDKQNKIVVPKENKEDEIDKDVIAINRTICAIPSDLPKEGTLEYPPLQIGQTVFATNLSTMLPWSEAILSTKENENLVNVYVDGKLNIIPIRSIAYVTPSPVQFPVGTRVLAKIDHNFKKIDYFYAGIIAEPPKLLNKFRYMIFFDDGCVQYQYHKNIRLVAYKFDNKLLLSEFHPDYRGFIKSYLDKYPERQMVRLINDHIIRVEYKNEWILAKVLEVDASLVKLYFIEKNCVEWLYRGSPRLWNIYEKQSKSDRGIRSRQSGLAYLKKPFVEYSSIEEPSRPAKTVARKSSTKSSTTQYEETKKLIPNNNVSSVLNLFSLPSNCLVPKKFVYHKCSFRCVEWTEYNYMKTKRINMLAVPLHFGFTRCVLNFNISQKCIIYRTPCGLGMRNLKEMHDYLIKTKSKMTIDQFDFNSWVRPLAEFKIVKHKIYSIDMSEGKEFKSISLVNTLSFETPPKMEYMTVRKAMPGVNINVENEFLCGCDCTDNCQDKSKCACWQLTIEGQKILPNLDQDPNIGYSYRRLPERVLTGIYECNKTCKCSKSCLNRVVQNPLSQKLQLFLTEKKGWGVRCLNDIPQGSFICIYVGYLLTETDANEGGKNYGDEYLAELDYIEVIEKIKEDYETDVVLSDDDYENNASNTNSESSSEDFQTTVRDTNIAHRLRKRDISKTKKDVRIPSKMNTQYMKNNHKLPKSMREYYGNNESVYIMDAKTSGNIGRYLNHSCSPNIFVQNVFVDTHDLRFPWVSFFALNYIQAGTELTWDYSYDIGSVPGKVMKCHCDSVYCRGRLL